MSTAAKVAAERIAHPERFCRAPRCLHRCHTRRGYVPCKSHPGYARTMMALASELATPADDDRDAVERARREYDRERYDGREAPAGDMAAGIDF